MAKSLEDLLALFQSMLNGEHGVQVNPTLLNQFYANSEIFFIENITASNCAAEPLNPTASHGTLLKAVLPYRHAPKIFLVIT